MYIEQLLLIFMKCCPSSLQAAGRISSFKPRKEKLLWFEQNNPYIQKEEQDIVHDQEKRRPCYYFSLDIDNLFEGVLRSFCDYSSL